MMTSLLPDQLDVEKLKIVGFDLDDTLAASKSPLSEKMGRTLPICSSVFRFKLFLVGVSSNSMLRF